MLYIIMSSETNTAVDRASTMCERCGMTLQTVNSRVTHSKHCPGKCAVCEEKGVPCIWDRNKWGKIAGFSIESSRCRSCKEDGVPCSLGHIVARSVRIKARGEKPKKRQRKLGSQGT